MRPTTKKIWSEVDISGPEAVWVLSAHVYALLVPLFFVFAVWANWDFLVETTYSPFLFFVAAVLMAAGGAFEAAQNTMDRWYLTEDSPSANGVGLLDFMFYWMITSGSAAAALAIGGDQAWVWVVCALCLIALPPLYFYDLPYFGPLTVASLVSIYLAFTTFGDPVIFLQLLLVAATMYFFHALLKTSRQTLHGFTTMAASSGSWVLIWVIVNSRNEQTDNWWLVAGITTVVVLAGIALWPVVMKLPATRRQSPVRLTDAAPEAVPEAKGNAR